MHAFSKELYDTMGVSVFILGSYMKPDGTLKRTQQWSMEKTTSISIAGVSMKMEYQYHLGETIMRNTMGQRN